MRRRSPRGLPSMRSRPHGQPAPALVERTVYHAAAGNALETGVFLPSPMYARAVTLAPKARQRRRQMLACFVSQRETLAPFGCESEAFRAAPVYDFTVPRTRDVFTTSASAGV